MKQYQLRLRQKGITQSMSRKGHENYQILKNETIHFDDREEARQALKEI